MTNGFRNDDVASLTERAYQAISSAIANLEFKPGEALKQDHLARWLSISRTPVREALRRLEQDGIIQTVPGRGLVVTGRGKWPSLFDLGNHRERRRSRRDAARAVH